MKVPGFSADFSLRRSGNHYRTYGMAGQPAADVLPTFLPTPLETVTASQPGLRLHHQCYDNVDCRPAMFMDYAHDAVVPMGVAAHTSSPGSSSQCTQCLANCMTDFWYWLADFEAGCYTLLAIPFAGPELYLACAAVAAPLAAGEIYNGCLDSCLAGGACCPVSCGSSACCDFSETCSDSTKGLCCSPGTAPCGSMCCQGNEVCSKGLCCPFGTTASNGFCCPPGSTACPDGTCCDNSCGQCQGGTCVTSSADGTPCPIGVCCSGACVSLVSNPDNCGACGNRCSGTTPFCIGGFCSGAQ